MRPLSVIILGLLLVTLQGIGSAAAAEGPPSSATIRVGVLPVRTFQRSHADLWGEADAIKQVDTSVLDGRMHRLIQREPIVHLMSSQEIRKRLTDARGAAELAVLGRERLKLGMELYTELRVDEAIPHLQRANKLLTDANLDLIDPDALATLSFTLAQCLIEKGRADEAHIALKEMFFRAPNRQFKKGFYSATVEKALERAWVDFVATYPRQNPVQSTSRMTALMQKINVEQLVYAYIDPSITGTIQQLTVIVYERRRANVTYRSALSLSDPEGDEEGLDRLLSRWTTCLPIAGFVRAKPKRVGSESFYIDTAFAYSRFLSDTSTRQGFDNLGLALSVEWRFHSDLGLYVQLHVLTSTHDYDRDLLSPYTTVRLQTGVSYSIRRSWWRLYFRAGVEGHFFGDFQTTTDPQCKFFGGDACEGQIQDFRRDIVMGPAAALGGSIFLSENLYMTGRVLATFFAFPFDKISEINYPLGGEFGIGYAF